MTGDDGRDDDGSVRNAQEEDSFEGSATAQGSNKENDASQVKSIASSGTRRIVKPDPDDDDDDDIVFRESRANQQ